MKKYLVYFFLFFFLKSFSQNFNVQSAADSYKDLKYTQKNRFKDLSDAKRYIDLAADNEQTANDPKMWNYRGKIYLEINRDTSAAARNLDPDAIEKSAVSFINCIKVDTKKNFTDDCYSNIWIAGIGLFNRGVEAYNKGDYSKAARYYSLISGIIPFDKDNNLKRNNITPEILNKNLYFTAFKSKDNTKAKDYLQKLIDAKYNDPMIYIYMSRIQLEEKDTTKALSYIAQGRTLFEENANLLNEEIRIYSLQGKYDVLLTKFSDAINLDADNHRAYYNRASIYENKKDYTNAETDYKKALELQPEYFDANYSLGIMFFNQAAELANSSSTIKNNDEFEQAKIKYGLKFKNAEPYLEKALDLNPKKSEEDMRLYKANLNALKQLYVRTGEMEKYNKIKALQEQQ